MNKFFVLLIMLFILNSEAAILYVLNSGSETLSRIDTITGIVDNAFASLGSMPNRLACTTDFIYVVNSGDNSIQKINALTGQTILNIFLETSANPYDLAIDEEYLYVTGALTNKVYKIDLDSDTLVDQITVGSNPAGLAASAGKLYVGNTDYMGNYANCSISVIDLENFTLIDNITAAVNPQYLLAEDNYVHVSCTGNWFDIMGTIQIIDVSTDSVIQAIPLNGYCGDLAYSSAGIIYIGDAMNEAVYAYYADTWEIIYSPQNPFTPGASVVEADPEFLATLGGEWGQNFTVRLYDLEENLITEFQAGLYATDMKFQPEASPENNCEILSSINITGFPNPFSSQIEFICSGSRAEISSLNIYDIKGRIVKTINTAGTITWDGKDQNDQILPSGIYFPRIMTDYGIFYTDKIVKIK
ncbi:MAG: T9SS type A sorting domain-containing protein [Candidatus Cloacimonetes bacterium]|nr:T9SS type A sorting domain-containing protein [Candidatus Cloacimonadota bacterium]